MTSSEWDSGSIVVASQLLITDDLGNVIGEWDTLGIRVFNPLTGTTFRIQPDASIRFTTSDPDEGNTTTIDSGVDGSGATRRKNLLLSSGDLNSHGVSQLTLESATDDGTSGAFLEANAPLYQADPNNAGQRETWHSAAYGTNWSDNGGAFRPVKYRLSSDGQQVSLIGMAKFTGTTTAPSTVFTLPAGYRPDGSCNFISCVQGNPVTPYAIGITSGGLVTVTQFGGTINPGPVSFEGINFYRSSS